MDDMKLGLWVMIIILVVCSNTKLNKAISLSQEEDLELENELKLLNKPPILTYEIQEGDIIDCIDINKQPALDHPLLKNHKIQTKPFTFPKSARKESSSKSKPSINLEHKYLKHCPSGSVPIRRTQKEDFMRIKSLSNLSTHVGLNGVNFPSNQLVVSLSMNENQPYYGVTGTMSAYNLSVAQDQASSTNLWVIGGPPQQLSVILAGWQVNPAVNGGDDTRMYIYWTGDGSQRTGCYNMLCRGFVQTDRTYYVGFPLRPTSFVGGDQYEIKLYVYQDRKSGNWWVSIYEDGKAIGYFPKELFPNLSNGAKQVAWGGIAKKGKNGMSPPLGSGNLPNGNFRVACYIRGIRYVNDQNLGIPPKQTELQQYIGDSKCYGLQDDRTCGGFDQMYYCFTYGGPGGKCGAAVKT